MMASIFPVVSKRRLVAALAVALSASPAFQTAISRADPLWTLYQKHDVFELSDALDRKPASHDPRQSFLRAAVLADFGYEDQSAAILRGLTHLADSDLERRARMLLVLDERSLFHYREALQDIAPLLSRAHGADLENRVRLLRAIEDVPPEATTGQRRLPALRKPMFAAAIGDGTFRLLVDTGATYSVLSPNAARRAGLNIRSARYEIESARGGKVRADVALGDLALAGLRIHNVVYLVLPDSAFRNALSFAGVIGLTELRQLGSVNFGRDSDGPVRGVAPVAFVAGELLVQIELRDADAICTLDTGATRSSFSASVWRRAGPISWSIFQRHPVTVNEAGGTRTLALHEAPVAILLGGRSVLLRRAMIFTHAAGSENNPACTLGADALAALEPITLDLRRMRLVLR